jgi:geranylgeranyl transferase type-2 subunit beta
MPLPVSARMGSSYSTLIGLSMLGYPGLQDIDPVYCMPTVVTERMGLKKEFQMLPRRTA